MFGFRSSAFVDYDQYFGTTKETKTNRSCGLSHMTCAHFVSLRTTKKNIVRIHKTNWKSLLFRFLLYHCFYSLSFLIFFRLMSFLFCFFSFTLSQCSLMYQLVSRTCRLFECFSLFVSIFDKKDDLKRRRWFVLKIFVLFVAIWKDILALCMKWFIYSSFSESQM